MSIRAISRCGSFILFFIAATAAQAAVEDLASLPSRSGASPIETERLTRILQTHVRGTELRAGGVSNSRAAGIVSPLTVRKSLALTDQPSVVAGTWNYFAPSYCAGVPYGGLDYFYMAMTDGSYIVTTVPVAISALAPACTTATEVAFFVTSVVGADFAWSEVVVYHP